MSARKQIFILLLAMIAILWLAWKLASAESLFECVIWTMITCVLLAIVFTYRSLKDQGNSSPSKPARWKVFLSFIGIIIVIYSWIPDFSTLDIPYYQTPKRVDLHPVSGKLVLYNNSYGLDLGERKIALQCPPTVRKRSGRRSVGKSPASEPCFPNNIEAYLGRIAESYLLKPLDKSNYTYVFYELKIGHEVLVSYDVISLKQAEAFKKTRETVVEDTKDSGIAASLFIVSPILMWIFEMAWSLWRRRAASSQGEASSLTDGRA